MFYQNLIIFNLYLDRFGFSYFLSIPRYIFVMLSLSILESTYLIPTLLMRTDYYYLMLYSKILTIIIVIKKTIFVLYNYFRKNNTYTNNIQCIKSKGNSQYLLRTNRFNFSKIVLIFFFRVRFSLFYNTCCSNCFFLRNKMLIHQTLVNTCNKFYDIGVLVAIAEKLIEFRSSSMAKKMGDGNSYGNVISPQWNLFRFLFLRVHKYMPTYYTYKS